MKARVTRSSLCLFALLASCDRSGSSVQTTAPETPDPRPELRVFEAERRAQTDFVTLPPSDHAFGPDPYVIKEIAAGKRFVSLMRGSDALVVLDASLRELSRLPAPASPSGMAVSLDGKTVFVVGERAGFVARYLVRDAPPYLIAAGRYELPDVRALRDVAVGPEGVLYAVEENQGRLITLFPGDGEATKPESVLPAQRRDLVLGGPPMQVTRAGKFVVTNCLLDHALVIRRVDERGALLETDQVRITHDGPIWSFSARPSADGLLLLAGGVEDHPLDRRGGFFGNIDSFVFLYRVSGGAMQLLASVNVSEFGVVTPKALELDVAPDGKPIAFVTGYGGERLVRFVFGDGDKPPFDVRVMPVPAGSRALAKLPRGGFVVANPLLDAFVMLSDKGEVRDIVRVEETQDEHRRLLRLGEALFFTVLMAPENKTDDAHSRFSCETCHFEGYVDGRVHHTGRGEVRVVTKPLLGLFNNRPHFSRALDPDLSAVAHAEFRVAGAGSDHSPWFALDPATHPTLAAFVPAFAAPLEPIELRRALMAFLMDFTHRTNQMVGGRTNFTPLEHEGAREFRDRCETCHEARTSTDEPGSRVPFERWESLLFSAAGPLVWAMNEYRQTNVIPYVHERGARVPSLRRLYKKRPYLTNGSAKDLASVLDKVRWTADGTFFHDAGPDGAMRLEPRAREAIRAFLELL